MTKKRIDINKLFLPHLPIRKQKDLFAGRRAELISAIEEIQIPGKSIIIYGERGVGKTSFAWQLYDLLQNENDLLKLWGLNDKLVNSKYGCVYIQCNKSITSIEDVLLRLLTPNSTRTSLPDVYPKVFDDQAYNENIKNKFKADLKVIGYELETNEKFKSNKTKIENLSNKKNLVHVLFEETVNKIKVTYELEELVIFIDEFNQLSNKEGVGDLIAGSEIAKFVIIGISDTIDEIIIDNEDAKYKLFNSSYQLPGLNVSEIEWIFDRAERLYQNRLKFSKDFRTSIIHNSDGFPWLIHAFGFESLKYVLKTNINNGVQIVKKEDYKVIEKSFLKNNMRSKEFIQIMDSDDSVKIEILLAVANANERWATYDYIESKVNPRMKKWVNKNLQELLDRNILKRNLECNYRFYDTLFRLYTLSFLS